MAKRMNAKNVPESLRPYIPLFEKWGDVQSDLTRYELIHRVKSDPASLQELKDFHARLLQLDKATFEDWLSSPLNESHERAKVYFTFLLMYGELEIEKL